MKRLRNELLRAVIFRNSLLLLFLIIFNTSISGQADTIPKYYIEDVVIRENRIRIPLSQMPSGLMIVDSVIINRSAVSSIADLLHNLAGIDIRQRGSNGIQNDASVRGSSFDQVLILVNGIKISDPQTGHHSFNLPVDISCIDHIEIYKGPSARVFGQNAFAGAINIITKNPSDTFLKLQSVAGDFGLAGIRISASAATPRVKNYFSLSHDRSDGYRYNTDYRISDFFWQSDLSARYGKINIISGISDRIFGANGFYASPDYTDQYEKIMTSLVALSFTPGIKNRMVTMTNRLYWRRNRDEYILMRYDPAFYRNLHINNTLGMDFNLSYQNKLGVTGIGLDMSVPWITSNRLGNRSRKDLTLFVEHRVSLFSGKMTIAPGFQANMLSGFEGNILPGIDIGYSVSPFLMLFANSGYTFRVPTFTDLYYEDPINSSNPALQPEYAFSNEAGVKTIKITGLTAQAVYFSRRNFNLIDRSKENQADKWKPGNIGEVNMNGVDVSMNLWPWILLQNKNFIIQRFDFGYSFINSRIAGDIPAYSRFVIENLRNQIVTGLELRYTKKIYQTVNVRYCDRLNMKDYTVSDTRIGWHSDKLDIYMDLTNIFNVQYTETSLVPLPGRWFKAGASYKFSFK